MNRKGVGIGMVLLLAALLLGSAGCTPWLWANDAAAFTAGWLARGLVPVSGDTAITCYRNGVAIDCADVPADLQPTP
jgi:hypothetical protein